MTRVPVDADVEGSTDTEAAAPDSAGSGYVVEIERERTKQRLIDSVTKVVLAALYMVFAWLRERDSGVTVIDERQGSDDDWKER